MFVTLTLDHSNHSALDLDQKSSPNPSQQKILAISEPFDIKMSQPRNVLPEFCKVADKAKRLYRGRTQLRPARCNLPRPLTQ